MEILLSKGTELRLNRIKYLKRFADDVDAIEWAISVGWVTAEAQNRKKESTHNGNDSSVP